MNYILINALLIAMGCDAAAIMTVIKWKYHIMIWFSSDESSFIFWENKITLYR